MDRSLIPCKSLLRYHSASLPNFHKNSKPTSFLCSLEYFINQIEKAVMLFSLALLCKWWTFLATLVLVPSSVLMAESNFMWGLFGHCEMATKFLMASGASFHVLIGHLWFSSEKMFLLIFCKYFHWVIVFLLWSFNSCVYFLDTSPLSGIWFVSIFCHCVTYVVTLLMRSFIDEVHQSTIVFNLGDIQFVNFFVVVACAFCVTFTGS